MVLNSNELKKEVEIKYLTGGLPNAVISYNKTMEYINGEDVNVTDMAAVEDINEIDLLNNLKNRFFQKQIFTNVGPTLIIMNPYQLIPGAFDVEQLDSWIKYHETTDVSKRSQIDNPHLYDLTLIAIKHLTEFKRNQAIVISGESGAGKTETAKYAMKCITYYFGKKQAAKQQDGNKQSLETQILGCNPILEAFGNSKTVRNDNSSRFGKYVTIFLDVSTGEIEGAQIQTYLLEKSRVCDPAKEERNYHIFYHLLAGAEDELLKTLYLQREPKSYKFLEASGVYSVKGVNDEKCFKECIDAFHVTGFSEDEILTVWKVVASCLLLGNISFKQSGEQTFVDDKDHESFINVCNLLGCDAQLLEQALTYNVRIIQGNVIKSPLKPAESIIFRNNFAKELYNRVFNWIVKKLNKQLAPDINMSDPNKKYIGLLDIFGFECFAFNSLEQMCINFTNEKLQQLYINDVFRAEQNEYVKEGLKDYISEISFKDNQGIIDTMDKAGSGMFQVLDDMCISNKDDKTFFEVVKKNHANNTNFKVTKIAQDEFAIVHTAKNVMYNTKGFVAKNLDEVKQTMTEAMQNSKNDVIKYIFMNVLNEEEYQHEMKQAEEDVKNPNKKKETK
jgi:myosin heavy subunit